MSALAIISFLALGAAAGALSGLLGIGGGVMLVPSLVFLFGMSEHLAQGTTLALMVPPIGLGAAYTYYKKGYVDLRIAGLICLGFATGGWIGAKLAESLSNAALTHIFAGALILIAMKMLLSQAAPTKEQPADCPKRAISILSACLIVVLGLLAGIFSGLLGIGGGIIIVPSLVYLFRLTQHEAQGTTLALMVPPIGLLGTWEYYQQGNVDIGIGLLICAGFFVGALFGAKLAATMSNRLLSRTFGGGMLLVACKMLFF
jgi:hypothetical protein